MTSALIVLATAASYALGWRLGWPRVLPVLNTVASYPFMIAALRRGELRVAVARMLVWAAALGVCSTLLSFARPFRTDTLFINGSAYRTEMFAWVMTGRGAESTPSLFIPQQLGHAALLAVLAFATAGFLAMCLGAVLMNYMGHYVGALAAASARPVLTMVLAWVPWAIIRVASFVVAGAVLAAPLAAGIGRSRERWRRWWTDAAPLLALAAMGIATDILVKALCAPVWQRMLLRVVGW